MLIELGGLQYRITKVNKDIVTIDPPLTSDQAEQSVVTKVTAFVPFDGAARNRQQHALYLGHKELFDIEAAATIEIVGAKQLAGVTWQYWGKGDPRTRIGWQTLQLASAEDQAKADGARPHQAEGLDGGARAGEGRQRESLDPRLRRTPSSPASRRCSSMRSRFASTAGTARRLRRRADPAAAPSAEAMANTTPLVLDSVFFPFGKEPRQFDTFYLGSKEAFSKKGADVALDFEHGGYDVHGALAGAAGRLRKSRARRCRAGWRVVLAGGECDDGCRRQVSRPRARLRPPPTDGNADVSAGIPLNRRPPGRLPVWSDAQDPEGLPRRDERGRRRLGVARELR